jgi:2-keto-4-pentenoate hydratase/2-oxohepta-3-ene-1,7-dioic acid hydratase in catechol pathway
LKLTTYFEGTNKRLGLTMGNYLFDLSLASRALLSDSALEDLLPPGLPLNLLALLQAGTEAWEIIQRVWDLVYQAGAAAPVLEFARPLSKIQHAPLIENPGKIICIGLNYADHCREQNFDIPTSMILFAKFPTAITGPNSPITWPEEISQQVDYEAELAVLIGRTARNVSEDAALEYVAGYTIANDVSARDVQFADQQWVRGKSFDTFCPLGPYLVTPDEVPDPHKLNIRCWVNGELRQDSNTDQMIFKVPEAIAFISKTCTLLPGDVICTGTPDGVGFFRKPPVFLKAGDLVEIEIDGLGRLSNPVA